MRAFVTGASGFIGRELVKYLVGDHGDTVVVLSPSEKADAVIREAVAEVAPKSAGFLPLVDDYVEVLRGDVNDPPELLIQGMRGCDVLYHLLAVESWDLSWRDVVEGTHKLIEAAKAANVPRFVHVSSIAVFQRPRKVKVGVVDAEEDDPRNPAPFLHYATASSIAEDIALGAATGSFWTACVRIPLVHGPHDGVLLDFLRNAMASKKWQFSKPDDLRVSILSVRNLAVGLRLTAVQGRSRQAYHFQDRESPMLARTFFSRYAQCIPDLKVPTSEGVLPDTRWKLAKVIEKLPPRFASFWKGRYWSRQVLAIVCCNLTFSSDKTRKELGYEPVTSFEQSMKQTAVWASQFQEQDPILNQTQFRSLSRSQTRGRGKVALAFDR